MDRVRPQAAGPTLIGVVVIASMAATVRAGRPLLAGPDPYWHWDLGRRIVADGLLAEDPYSFLTAGRSWMLNQWGADLVFGLVDRAGGLSLLAQFTALLVGVVFLTTGWVMWRRAPSLWTVPLLGLVYLASVTNLTMRGNLFTFLLLPVLLGELLRAGEARPLVLGLLMALWTNLHAGFLLGLALIALHGVGRVLASETAMRLRVLRHIALVFAVSSLATLATPYGPGVLSQSVKLAGRAGTAGVTEWGAPALFELKALPFTVLAGTALVAVAITGTRSHLPEVLPLVGCVFLGASAVRNLAPAAIAIGVLAAPHIAAAGRLLRDRDVHRTTRPASPVDKLVVATVGLATLVTVTALTPRSDSASAHAHATPLAAIDALSQEPGARRVFSEAVWAPAISILGGGQIRTAIDGRLELYSDEELQAWRDVRGAMHGWASRLADWCVTDLVVMADAPLASAIAQEATDDWLLALRSPLSRDPHAAVVWFTIRDTECRSDPR